MSKYHIISHVTTACNYDCSYCDVIKDKKRISREHRDYLITFIGRNFQNIERFKFFGGEPLLGFKDIKYIIDETHDLIGNNFEIVTNTTLLNDEIGEYLQKYFSHIFFSIDSENIFNYEKVLNCISKFQLEHKLYFNLIVSPGKEKEAYNQFLKLYDNGMRGFNILPVYFTLPWSGQNLKDFSSVMKHILDISCSDSTLRLYGFGENLGEKTSLTNNSIFIDIDGEVYFSDMVSTFLGNSLKQKLYLGNVGNINLQDISTGDFNVFEKHISLLQDKNYADVSGQKELHKIMDYFSVYLNKK